MHFRRLRRAWEIARTEGIHALAKKVVRRIPQALKRRWLHLVYEWKLRLLRSRFAEERNLRLAIAEQRERKIFMSANPQEITIESTTFCNLKCVMCEHGFDGIVVNKRHFPERLVRRLLPFLSTASRFQLHALGEPLMSPAFWKLLDEITAVHRGAPDISFNTNGLLLNEKNIARLLATKVREINISFDAATAETYERIRGADFSKLVANVSALVQARDLAGRGDLKILMNMTLMRANIEELPEFVRLACRLGVDEVAFWRMNDGEHHERPDWVIEKEDWKFSYSDESPKYYPNLFNAKIREAVQVAQEINVRIIQGAELLIEGEGSREDRQYSPHSVESSSSAAVTIPKTAVEIRHAPITPPEVFEIGPQRDAPRLRIDPPSGIPAPKSATIGACTAPWKWLLVNNQGDCLPCCYLMGGSLGNLHQQTVEEIWNGQTIREIRTAIANDEVHPFCQGASCKFVRGDSSEGKLTAPIGNADIA